MNSINLTKKTDAILSQLNQLRECIRVKNSKLIYDDSYNESIQWEAKQKLNANLDSLNKQTESGGSSKSPLKNRKSNSTNDENFNILQRSKIRIGLSRRRRRSNNHY